MTDEPLDGVQNLELGNTRSSAAKPVRLPTRALLRHMMALGSSGSGKTVLAKVVVEEVVRAGIPALCLDPQGDLCSLALAANDPDALVERGLDPELARSFAERCDAVIFTPASDKGIALGADPIAAALASGDAQAIDEELWTRAAGTVASLLGYATDDDDGQGFVAVLDSILRELAGRGHAPKSLRALTDYLAGLDDAALAPYAKFWELKPLRQAIRKLARLEVGPRRKLFAGGLPLDIDVLLGRSEQPELATPAGKVRVAIIHLNSLHQQEDKEFLVAAIAERLYAWMLANPKPDPQVLFYLDEVAPFIPPVRKPQCKDSLQLVFKQARKYGVCCLMATQNPGDVDYRAMAQFGTWALGRLTTRQDLKKVEPTVKSLAPAACDAVMAELPKLKPGQFVLLSPDHFAEPTGLQTRWLYTQHETLDEGRIAKLADERWRARFASALAPEEPEPAKPAAAKPKPDTPAKRPAAKPKPDTPAKKPAAKPKPAAEPKPSASPEKPKRTAKQAAEADRERQLAALREHGPVEVKRFAELLGCSETTARRALQKLVEEQLAGEYKRGRSTSYWLLDTGTRPDLAMPDSILVATPSLNQEQATLLGQGLLRSSLLGLGGPAETLINTSLIHKLLWRVDFEERITASLLGRLIGPAFEDRIGSVYLHPQTLAVLTWDRARGIRFVERPAEHASDVHDLDGVVRFAHMAPGGLRFDEAEWGSRRSEADVRDAFSSRWPARIAAVAPCFLSVWKLAIRRHEPAGIRVVLLDAIAGHGIDWPGA
jgi:outer membrane biosynthesis protein TonB